MEVLGNDELVILIYFLLYYIFSFFFLLEYLDFIGFFFGDFVYGLVKILFLNKIKKFLIVYLIGKLLGFLKVLFLKLLLYLLL